MRTRCATALLLVSALLSSGACAHPVRRNDWAAYPDPGRELLLAEELEFPDVPDPLEPWNRSVFEFNRALFSYVVDPASTLWRRLTPQDLRSGLVRAAANLGYPARLVNNLLQAKWRGAGDETLRFFTNTLLGLGGFFDPARTQFGVAPSDEDMGQTFAQWGWRDSTFLTLPVFGPSTSRDALGLVGDMPLDPAFYFFPAGPIKAFIVGAEQVEAARRLMDTKQDAYSAVRYLWVLNRRVLTEDYRAEAEPSAASETIQTIYLQPRDPWFARGARVLRAEIPSTGRRLAYQLWLQHGSAPVVFILPGLGGHRDANNSLALAEMVFSRGFSAVTLSSAFNFDFFESASTTDVPGFAPIDARDVHVALDAIARDLEGRYPGRTTRRVLMGISMGGFHTLFIAAAESDPELDLLGFDRYLALYPPVRFEQGMRRLDAFYNAPLAFPEDVREERVVGILQKVVSLDPENDLEPGEPLPLSRIEAQFLIGLAFRLTLHDLIWISQERRDLGVLQTRRSSLRRSAVTREILEFSFMEYLFAFVLPYYRERDPGIDSVERILELSNLHAIAPALAANGKIRVFSNENDFLVTSDDVEWLAELLGEENVTFYSQGGHMGNLYLPEVQAEVMDSLADLL